MRISSLRAACVAMLLSAMTATGATAQSNPVLLPLVMTGRAAAPTAVPTAAPTSAPVVSPTLAPAPGSPLGAQAAAVLQITNDERAKAGCNPLKASALLTQASQAHTDWMAATKTMSHTGLNGSTMQSRVEATGYRWSSLGENVAMGYSDAASVMKGWMGSSGHRANILNCKFTEIGIGYALDSNKRPYWTQDFGTPR